MKELLKSDSICQSYVQIKKGPVFWLTVYKHIQISDADDYLSRLFPLPPLSHIWDVILVWRNGKINRTVSRLCLCASVLCTIMVHIQFIQVGWLDLAQHLSDSSANNPVIVERVQQFKLLGITISQDVNWQTHIDAIITKVCSRLYFLKILKKVGS